MVRQQLKSKSLVQGVRSCINFLYAASFLMFPSKCLLCTAEDEVLCPRCFARLKYYYSVKSVESSCEVLLKGDGTPRIKVLAGARYAQGVNDGRIGNNATIISFYKKYGAFVLKRYFAEAFAKNLVALLSEITNENGEESAEIKRILLVPVPNSLKSFVKRGFSPVAGALKSTYFEERCKLLYDTFGIGVGFSELLRLTVRGSIFHVSQKNLTARQRTRSQLGTMKISFLGRLRLYRQCFPDRRKLKKSSEKTFGKILYVIVDDVLTTGATLNEAHRALSRGLSRTLSSGNQRAKAHSPGYSADCDNAIVVASTGY